MASSLGADLGAVRVHTGPESATAAKAVGARAYTTGQDIHFAPGQYDPASAIGQHLLAHEVAHTVQQQGSTGGETQQKTEASTPGDTQEVEADSFAEAFMAGGRVSSIRSAARLQTIQRKEDDTAPTQPASSKQTDEASGDLDGLLRKGNKWIDRVFANRFAQFRSAVDQLDHSLASSIEVAVLKDTRRAEKCAVGL